MKTLALVHGWGATGESWKGLRESLGGSWRVEAPTLPEWRAEWLAQWLTGLPLPETLAVGWSLGGMLLLEAVARAGVRPAALVLVGVPAVFCQRPDCPWGQPPAAVRAMRRALTQDPARVLAEFARRSLAPGEEAWLAEARRLFPAGQAPAHLALGLDYLLATDLRLWLGEISLPVTLVQGEEDAIVRPAQAALLKDHLPPAELLLLPGAGHLPFLTRAGEFQAILVAKLKG
ncbi:MAG: alpha/beta fold hydrolase [Syntrophobacterales bacterium]|nr:alpha/beta fold hydrolase [Syntrophobacterales bacterium]